VFEPLSTARISNGKRVFWAMTACRDFLNREPPFLVRKITEAYGF
jgi:hypothetical protein